MDQLREPGKQQWQMVIIGTVLVLLTVAVYWPTLGYDFVNYDDGDYVISNEHVQAGITRDSLAWAFTTGHASNWHPLTWISHELDCQIFGNKAGGAHLTNLIFHIVNTLLLFVVLRRMTGVIWPGAFVAALFAWHPTHVESVAWISERKDVLSAFFWLLTMMAYAEYVQSLRSKVPSQTIGWFYILALVLFLCGLMSKPVVVTLPFALLLLDFWPLRRIGDSGLRNAGLKETKAANLRSITFFQAVVEKIPFLLLAAASSVVTFVVQRRGGAVASLNAMPAGARFENALVSYLRYVGKLLWPAHLSVLYPMPALWPVALVVIAGAFVAGISVLVVWQRKRRPYLFVGWYWFAGALVPVIGLVQVGVQSMADRYLYVPAIGVFIAVAWGAAELASGLAKRRELLAAGAGLALTGCSLLTWAQVHYWQNGETLFRHAIKATGNNYLAYNNLGYFLENHGKATEATEYYRKSVEINPAYEEARNNLGHILRTQGKDEEAIIHLQEALKIKPELVEARNNLGNALGDLGRQNEAIEQYELALHYKTNDTDALNNLGVARAMQGRLDEAGKLLEAAVRFKPADAGAHRNLGNVLAMQHKPDEAMREYETALQLNPDDPQAHYNLANVYLERGKWEAAVEQYQAAIKLRPENPDAQYKLGLALAAQGKRAEAVAHFRESLRLNPNQSEAQSRITELLNGK